MPGSTVNHNESDAIVFDITKPVEGITFLGLLDRSGQSGNNLTGLFDWRCCHCGTSNRDAVIVETEQAFLSQWLCRGCEEAMIVRFRARGSAEWVAEHTLAITGQDLCHLAEGNFVSDAVSASGNRGERSGQRLFAWIAIPALVALIFLGLSDMRRFSNVSASGGRAESPSDGSSVTARLPGRWTSDNGQDCLVFGAVDAISHRGTYVHLTDGRRAGESVRFAVISENRGGEQLIIRPLLEEADETGADLSNANGPSDVTLYIPVHGRTLTWIDTREGKPLLKAYHRIGSASASTGGAPAEFFEN